MRGVAQVASASPSGTVRSSRVTRLKVAVRGEGDGRTLLSATATQARWS